MRKKLLSMCLVLAMVLSLMPAAVWAADDLILDVYTSEELAEKVNAAEDGSIVRLMKTIETESDIEINIPGNPIPENKTITLDLNGNAINFTPNYKSGNPPDIGTLKINVGSDCELIIKGGVITQTKPSNSDPAVEIVTGTVTISGTRIEGNYNGIVVSRGALTVSGGAKVKGNENGIQVSNGELTVSGTDTTVEGVNGVGIGVTGGSLTVESGAITGDEYGIQFAGDMLQIKGGNIKNEYPYLQKDPSAKRVAGIVVDSASTIVFSGGNISGPTALYFSSDVANVYVNGGKFTNTVEDGESVKVEGNNPREFITGGKFVKQVAGSKEEKDKLPADYLYPEAIQLEDGTVDIPEKRVLIITLDLNYESAPELENKTLKALNGGRLIEPLPIPKRDGYRFLGWYTAPEEGEKVTEEGPFYGNITLYAHWIKLFTITFDPNGGTFGTDEDGEEIREIRTAEEGSPLTDWPDDPEREGYTFIDWYDEDNSTETPFDRETVFESGTMDDTTTLSAHWGYTIIFNPNGGVFKEEDVDKDGNTTRKTGDEQSNFKVPEGMWPADPEPKGSYKFDGWHTAAKGGDPVTEETEFKKDQTVVYAHWIERKNIDLIAAPNTLSVKDNLNKEITLTANSDFVGTVSEEMFTVTLNGEEVTDWSFETVPGGDAESVKAVKITLAEAPDAAGTLRITAKESAFKIPPTRDPFVDIPVMYTITFHTGVIGRFENGSHETTTAVKEGDKIQLPLDPELDPENPVSYKYEFTGWYTDENEEDAELVHDGITITIDNIEEYTHLYAGWKQVIFTVVFNANGSEWDDGSRTKEKDTEKNGTLSELPPDPISPRDDGLVFDGWYTDQTYGEKVTTTTVFGEDGKDYINVYAHWKLESDTYKITFHADPGKFEDNETSKEIVITGEYLTEADLKKVSTPTRNDKYVFAGWYTDRDGKGKEVTTEYRFINDTDVYAHWRVGPPYEVTFDPNGGELVSGSKQTVETDGEGKLPKEYLDAKRYPSRNGYSFKGWYTEKTGGSLVTADTVFYEETNVIYARWELTITFDLNYETGEGTDRTFTTKIEVDENDEGKLDSLPAAPTRAGWIFDGWYTEKENGEKVTTEFIFRKAITIYAHWTEKEEFTVTFNANGGTLTGSATARTEEGRVTSWPTAIRDGYRFMGWFTAASGGDPVPEDNVFTSDTTVYAHWMEKIGYDITFDANGGTVSPTSATTDKDGKLSTLPTPTRTGYDFDGWFTAASGGTEVTTDTVFKEDTTIYAHWTEQDKTDDPTEPGGEKGTYYIQIDPGIRHGKVYTDPSSLSAEEGSTVQLIVKPDSDYTVDSVEIRPTSGQSIWLYPSGETCSFVMPASDVTIYGKFTLRPEYNSFVPPQTQPQYQDQSQTSTKGTLPTSAFTSVTWRPAADMWDVPASSWAYPAAQWAYQNGFLDTASDGSFRLNDTVSHMQLWRIMARWLGEPSLDDNSVNQWARKSGATRIGSASGAMTRQNMVEYLYQCYFLMGGDVSVTGNLIQYRDGQQVTSGSAKNAWLWAVNKGIISGTTDGYLNPNKVLSRGEFASILMRLCQKG